MNEIDDRSFEVERAVLGAVLSGKEIPEYLHPFHFAWKPYAIAWSCVEQVRDAGMTVDQITVGDLMERMGILDDFCLNGPQIAYRGRAALSLFLVDMFFKDADSYALLVLDYYNRRQIELICMEAYKQSVGDSRPVKSIAFDLLAGINGVRDFGASKSVHISAALSEAWDESHRAAQGEIVSIPSGYDDLDYLLDGGFPGAALILIAGRPGQGKTALIVSLINNIARNGYNVMCFSLEMMNRQIARRLISMESGVSYGAQRKPMSGDQWGSFNRAIDNLSGLNITLNDLASISVDEIRREFILQNAKRKIDILFVDYIQLVATLNAGETRALDVSQISRGLKALSKEFDIPVVAAAQLSRAIEQRADKEPVLSDLRESGSLEQDSDIVMFISRKDDSSEQSNVSALKIKKHRNGSVGDVNLLFKPNMTRFEGCKTRKVNLNEI
jgi:replicative DNA helicase